MDKTWVKIRLVEGESEVTERRDKDRNGITGKQTDDWHVVVSKFTTMDWMAFVV